MSKLAETLTQAEDLALMAWRRGYIAALAALAQYGQDTIYDDVVVCSGEPEALMLQARRDGAMRWSGLSGFLKRDRGNLS